MTNSPFPTECPPLPIIPGYNDRDEARGEDPKSGLRRRSRTLPACPRALAQFIAEPEAWS